MMQTIVYYTTGLLLLSVGVFIWLERKFPYTRGLPLFRDGFWVDLVWYTLIQSYFLKIFIFDYIILPADKAGHLSSLHLVGSWPLAVQVLFFLVVHDFYIYWFHRWQHHSKILWRTHEAHHSNKEIDWLAGTRSHSLEILINQTVEFAPIIFLGANPLVVPIKALLDAVWGMYIHSNIDVRSGKLQYFINGPEMHQWHHANHREVFYANFSTKFAIWDWLFGTAYLPGKKPSVFGLYYDYPKDYFLQHLFALKRVDEKELVEKYRLFRVYHSSRQKVLRGLRALTRPEFSEKDNRSEKDNGKVRPLMGNGQSDFGNEKSDLVNKRSDVVDEQTDVINDQSNVVNKHSDAVNRQSDAVNKQSDVGNERPIVVSNAVIEN